MRQLIGFFLLILLFTACSPVGTLPEGISHERYTEVAKTVAVQLTQNALLTPSVTPTATPEPTATSTNTPEPTPTVPTSTPTWSYHNKGVIKAPILVYYHIADDNADNPDYNPDSPYNIPSDTFRDQLTTLRENGYVPIPISLLTDAILFGAELPPKPIVLTFDSTAAGIYNKAFPVMKDMDYIGAVFLTVNQIGQEGMLSVDQIEEMIASGWIVGSRGMNGYNLTANHDLLSPEISGSRLALEELLNQPVTLFAYPEGKMDDVILPRVSAWGYEAAVGLTWYTDSRHSDQTIYYLSRFEVLNGETVDDILGKLSS